MESGVEDEEWDLWLSVRGLASVGKGGRRGTTYGEAEKSSYWKGRRVMCFFIGF